MLEKLETCDEKSPDGTSYNDFPVGWRRISRKDFVQGMFFSYAPKYIEHRQMLKKRADGSLDYQEACVKGLLYWFHDGTGVAMVSDYYKGSITYFAFGCKHDYRGMSLQECHERNIYHGGRCYSVSECKKCKNILAIDSSD